MNALSKRHTLAVALQDKASGKRIMGMTPQNSIATVVASKPHALWAVPEHWTLAQGATVPVAYATAYDALVVRGRLQAHHRVLIHSATGAVGLAATRISLNRGCEVPPHCPDLGMLRPHPLWLPYRTQWGWLWGSFASWELSMMALCNGECC